MSGSPPHLVSCILPTRDRFDFFRQALGCFLGQTYQPAELIVVDDGERSVARLCAGLDRVRYIRLSRPEHTGIKLNIGIEEARGSVLQKLDDDDYYHPDFLKTAAAALALHSGQSVITWDCFLVLLAGEAAARYTGHGWSAGGTLCFSRALWECAPFQELTLGEDRWFLGDHREQVKTVCAPELYILVRHGRNTWTMHENDSVDECFRLLPVYAKPLERLIDRRQLKFYRSLKYAPPVG